jgi:hypothetical protein
MCSVVLERSMSLVDQTSSPLLRASEYVCMYSKLLDFWSCSLVRLVKNHTGTDATAGTKLITAVILKFEP